MHYAPALITISLFAGYHLRTSQAVAELERIQGLPR